MTEHITAEEWASYFSAGGVASQSRTDLYAKVHAHVGACAQCRALWEAGRKLSEAADEFSSERSSCAETDTGYLKVASFEEGQQEEKENSIVLLIMKYSGELALEKDITLNGDAGIYAFRETGNGLVEDSDEMMYIRCENGRLTVSMPDTEIALFDEDNRKVMPVCCREGYAEYIPDADGSYVLCCKF